MLPIAIASRPRQGQIIAHALGRSRHFTARLVKTIGTSGRPEADVRRILRQARMQVDYASGRTAAIQNSYRPSHNLHVLESAPVDIEKVGNEARRIAERYSIEQYLDTSDTVLAENSLSTDRDVDTFSVGLVVTFQAGYALQRLFRSDSPRHLQKRLGYHDGSRGRIRRQRHVEPGCIDRDFLLLNFLGKHGNIECSGGALNFVDERLRVITGRVEHQRYLDDVWLQLQNKLALVIGVGPQTQFRRCHYYFVDGTAIHIMDGTG